MKHFLSIDFYGIPIRIIKGDDGYYWVPVKQICEQIGIDFQKQLTKIKHSEIIVSIYHMVYSKKGDRRTFCLRKDHLGFWLATLQTKSIINLEVRNKLLLYQREICQVIDNYLTNGIALNYHRYAHTEQATVLKFLEIDTEIQGMAAIQFEMLNAIAPKGKPGEIDRKGRIKDALKPARYAASGKRFEDPYQPILFKAN